MGESGRFVLDTNVVISSILFPGSVVHRAMLHAQTGRILASDATILELIQSLNHSRFDRYIDTGIRQALAAEYVSACDLIPIPFPIRACRDPRDDKFLEVALHGQANVIITGDQDLLVLHPLQEIAILTPAQFLEQRPAI